MLLRPEEPEAEPWRAETAAGLLDRLLRDVPHDRSALIAVDGRGGSGKSTVARLLAEAGGGTVVHSDDVAWNHSFFDWHDRLVEHVLEPARRGDAVDWRPAEWPDDKAGSIVVPAGTPLVVVEGVSVGAARIAGRFDRLLWVQTDFAEAERLGLERDVAQGRTPAEAKRFWDEWMAQELVVQAREHAWDRADAIVQGHTGTADRLLVAPPLHTDRASTAAGTASGSRQ